ncbi:endolytic transglycosylase MltG [Phyllobacterium sp. 21LDTY02-6]|uniref:endolytic transglycosylase MltG n=1 Tax=Phyllobacterium sp. 21LDTY02-6 TaxID=2944903 RepID=UPI0020220A3B|nr:endolytic transglycosylase MltG [Phyllobacterium sp. 21LDTY02-6]MCO4319752.1 endolytic transglycosylase MltG [Phyllobacterium sp. 21LDTY02-6]
MNGSAGTPERKLIVPQSASEALRPEPGTPPPPKRRSRRARSQIVVFANFMLSLVVLAVIAAAAVVYFGKVSFNAAGPLDVATNYVVRSGTGIMEIADGLERRGIISDARVFRYGVQSYGHQGDLKAGEYEIKPHASMRDIMDLLRSGRSVLHSLTVPEGLTVEQIFQRIREDDVLTGDLPAIMPPEGSLFANTMRFSRGTTREEIVKKMQADQKKLVEDIWERRDRDLPIKTIEEFVTLASIVEKETGKADERPRVAAVFINRLNKRMRLQSDPTILYGLFGGKGRPADRPILKSDLEKPTPYNTYTINGLPPGPIANPGRDALEAVAHPSQTKELYFVADGTGGHVFAETLNDHNENVRRWRQVEKNRLDEAAKAATGDENAVPVDGAVGN